MVLSFRAQSEFFITSNVAQGHFALFKRVKRAKRVFKNVTSKDVRGAANHIRQQSLMMSSISHSSTMSPLREIAITSIATHPCMSSRHVPRIIIVRVMSLRANIRARECLLNYIEVHHRHTFREDSHVCIF